MELQDKEFDKLFSSKLEDFEAEPSKAVWQGINEQLGGNNRRRIIPFLSIAASIIVLIGAGVLFITHKSEVVKPVKNRFAVNHSKITPATTVKQPVTELPKVLPSITNRVAVLHHTQKTNAIITPKQAPGIAVVKQQPANTVTQPVLAAVTQKQQNIVRHDSITTQTLLASAPVITHQPEKPVVLASIAPVDDKPAAATPVKKHRLRSFGDVLNVVIAAVDKRKDKVIEFTDTDDDEATITGVNLGFIRVKKEN